VHAAAGGTGLILCQWGKMLGATVIGVVGSDEKAEILRENGCEHVIVYSRENVVERVKAITEGRGVNVVYDSVGQATFMQSLDCLMPFGLMVSFGQASGPIPPIDVSLLMQKGSLFLTRPSLMHYKQDQVEYITGAAEIFSLVMRGVVTVNIGQSYFLKDAARAHRELEARQTKGSSVLIMG
jgi:NADPH2:quinone reductase